MGTLTIFLVVTIAICAEAVTKNETDGLRAVAESSEEFSKQFLHEVVALNRMKLITSPLSAQLVLAMTAYGAGGRTAFEMRRGLRIPSDNDLGQAGYESLIKTLNNVRGVQLSVANKIYTAYNSSLKNTFKQLTAKKFNSSSQELDFENPEAAANTINSWCAQRTHNRITDLIDSGSLRPDTQVVLVNAVYFKGTWKTKFDSKDTLDRPFNVDTWTVKNISTMFVKSEFRIGNIPVADAKFVEIPYQNSEVSMIIILPNDKDGLKTVYNNLYRINLTESLEQGNFSKVEIFLPKFKIESTLDLKETLENMGMNDMFQSSADFSGISDAPLRVSKVIQKAFIEVNEEGSEAAAATAAVLVTRVILLPTAVETFRVDRPYAFVIYHHVTNVALFIGYVHEPSMT